MLAASDSRGMLSAATAASDVDNTSSSGRRKRLFRKEMNRTTLSEWTGWYWVGRGRVGGRGEVR